MNNNDIVKNVLAYNKAGFENAFNSLSFIQNQAEGFIETALNANSYFPDEGKAMVKSWIRMSKDARDNVKKAMATGHEQLASMVGTKC